TSRRRLRVRSNCGSTLPIPMLAPPCRGALTRSLAEPAAEMRLIGEPARLCDVGQRDVAEQHEIARVLHSSSGQVGVRWFAEGAFEAVREMREAQAGDFTERHDPDRLVQMLFDKACDPANLPLGKSAGHMTLRRPRRGAIEPRGAFELHT